MVRLFVVCVAFVLGTVPAVATEIVHKTRFVHYQIEGETPGELVREMNRKGEKTGTRVMLASISTEANYVMKFATPNCERGRLHVNADFAVTLPKPKSRLPEPTAQRFNGFYAFLRSHEEDHRKINLQCMANVKRQTDRLLATMRGCSERASMRVKLAAIIADQSKQCARRHQALDRRDEPLVAASELYRAANVQSGTSKNRAQTNDANRQAFAYHPATVQRR